MIKLLKNFFLVSPKANKIAMSIEIKEIQATKGW